MICNNNYLADILRVCEIKDLIWVMRFQSPLVYVCARPFICVLWSPAGKGLTSWLSFVVSNCEIVTFPLVSWVRCGT